MKAELVKRETLSPDDRAQMFALFSAHYIPENSELFNRDLSQKDWVILLRDEASTEIVGFSSLAIFGDNVNDRPVLVVYSGDTIVKEQARSAPHLARAWIRAVLELTKGEVLPVYWLLLCGGYKTYRFLPVFFRSFFPRFDRQESDALAKLRAQLCTKRFGTQYISDRGIVRFEHGATPLRPGVADIPHQRLSDPHIKFFAKQNPGWHLGDELACIASLEVDNFSEAGLRMVR